MDFFQFFLSHLFQQASFQTTLSYLSPLIAFDSAVNILDEDKTDTEPSTPQHEEGSKGDDSHVSKVKGGLKETTHSTCKKVEIEGISVKKETNHSTIEEGGPPPAMILTR
mmetsp:Transcript_11089/g.16805  ORF Transcript_11089/g.16805 Transcript_11089/m.16805 type:complete len:110 (+) Transcript_11089:147-476(+)